MDSAATTTCSESNQTIDTASIDDEIYSPGKPSSSQGTLAAKIMEVSTTEEGTDVATTTAEANPDTTN